MLLGLGSFLIAIGILAVPHHETIKELMADLSAGNGRTTFSVGSIVVGVLLGVVGSIMGMSKKQAA
jgi:hypothetical protein